MTLRRARGRGRGGGEGARALAAVWVHDAFRGVICHFQALRRGVVAAGGVFLTRHARLRDVVAVHGSAAVIRALLGRVHLDRRRVEAKGLHTFCARWGRHVEANIGAGREYNTLKGSKCASQCSRRWFSMRCQTSFCSGVARSISSLVGWMLWPATEERPRLARIIERNMVAAHGRGRQVARWSEACEGVRRAGASRPRVRSCVAHGCGGVC